LPQAYFVEISADTEILSWDSTEIVSRLSSSKDCLVWSAVILFNWISFWRFRICRSEMLSCKFKNLIFDRYSSVFHLWKILEVCLDDRHKEISFSAEIKDCLRMLTFFCKSMLDFSVKLRMNSVWVWLALLAFSSFSTLVKVCWRVLSKLTVSVVFCKELESSSFVVFSSERQMDDMLLAFESVS